jgi:hypothetical protein
MKKRFNNILKHNYIISRAINKQMGVRLYPHVYLVNFKERVNNEEGD